MSTLTNNFRKRIKAKDIISWEMPEALEAICKEDPDTKDSIHEATIDLFSIVADNNEVSLEKLDTALSEGALVNARRIPVKNDPLRMEQPLDIALWVMAHDDEDEIINAIDDDMDAEANSPMVQMLLEHGAETYRTPRELLGDDSNWLKIEECQQIEKMHLDRIKSFPHLYQEFSIKARDKRIIGDEILESVVPVDGRSPQTWLHRAIAHQRWDIFKIWEDNDFALSQSGGASVCGPLAKAFLCVVRPNDCHYEVISSVERMLKFNNNESFRFELLSIIEEMGEWTNKKHKKQSMFKTLEDLVKNQMIARPLNSFLLSGDERNRLNLNSNYVQNFLLDIEKDYLNKSLSPSLPLVRQRSRL